MSTWSYINGVIRVSPEGLSTAHNRFILETVLNHLPVVRGSERSMRTYIVEPKDYCFQSDMDEYGNESNNLGFRNDKITEVCRDEMDVVYAFLVVIDGRLRDVGFDEAKKSFMKWMCRFAKRLFVEDIMVKISSEDKRLILDDWRTFADMNEDNTITKDVFQWQKKLYKKIMK